MNAPKHQDSPSAATLFGRGFCGLLPIPLFLFIWPCAIVSGYDLMWKSGSTLRGSGDVGDLMQMTWNMGVGLFIGIQLSANIFRRTMNIRVFRDSFQVGVTFVLTLFSAFCVVGTILCNGESVVALSNDAFHEQLLDLIVVAVSFTPVVAWFLVNLLRLLRKDYLLGAFLSS